MSEKTIIFIIFDGVENSVFEGQVLQPIVKFYAHANKVLLISFEKNFNNKNLINLINKIESRHPNLSLKIINRLPFFGKISLFSCIYKLQKILKNFKNYKIIARGPIAGLIAIKSVDNKNCELINIQARGLLPDEYMHSKNSKNIFKQIWYNFRKNIFYNLEKAVYKEHKNLNCKIETVSSALKDYLLNNYNCPENNINIAENDIPEVFPLSIIKKWKIESRDLLKIPENSIVYCYSGSAKSWQCPELVISFFQDKLKTEKDAYLLIFTQDINIFKNILEKSKLDPQKYFIKNVDYTQIYQYLSAADYGLIFREINILNWISRPTKVLEYEAVGLKIVHNNTVKWLVDKY